MDIYLARKIQKELYKSIAFSDVRDSVKGMRTLFDINNKLIYLVFCKVSNRDYVNISSSIIERFYKDVRYGIKVVIHFMYDDEGELPKGCYLVEIIEID